MTAILHGVESFKIIDILCSAFVIYNFFLKENIGVFYS